MTGPSWRVVLITGASSGIGRSCAQLLSSRGDHVYGASRSGSGEGFLPLRMDVRDEASVTRAIADILSREGRLDAVINNAGSGLAGAIEDTSIEEAQAQFDVNFFGTLRVCRAALPVLRRQNGGTIVNIGSIGGLIAIPYQGLYSASKFALEGLTEALRLEARDFGIRVVLVEPGDHRTAFTASRQTAAASHGESAHGGRFEKAVARMAADEQNGPGPEGAARLIARILDTRNPRLRYTVGPTQQRLAVWLKRLLPYAAIESLMRTYYMHS